MSSPGYVGNYINAVPNRLSLDLIQSFPSRSSLMLLNRLHNSDVPFFQANRTADPTRNAYQAAALLVSLKLSRDLLSHSIIAHDYRVKVNSSLSVYCPQLHNSEMSVAVI